MERVTVRQIFQIVKDTFKKNTGRIILILVLQLAMVVIAWFVQTRVISGLWGQCFFQLLSGLGTLFLVQCPLYFAVYCYLTGRPFERENTVERLRRRAVPLLCVSLFGTVVTIVISQILPIPLEQYMFHVAPLSKEEYLLINIVVLFLQILDMAISIWFVYLSMTIVVSEPGEKRIPQKATRILFESFGTRVKLILCALIVLAIPNLILQQLPSSDWIVSLWDSVMFVVMQLVQMAILISLFPKEERKQLKKKAP